MAPDVMDIGMKCDSLYSYTPSTWGEYFTGPTRVFWQDNNIAAMIKEITKHSTFPSLFLSAENRVVSGKFLDSQNFANYAIAHNMTAHKLAIEIIDSVEESYTVHSLANIAMQKAMFGAIYRVLDLASISIQHRINRSQHSNLTKLISCTVVSTLPYFIMSYLGYLSIELVIATGVRVAISYLISNPSYKNFVREIDLISSLKSFNITNFIYQNSAYGVRNLATSILMEKLGPLISNFSAEKCLEKTTKIKVCFGVGRKPVIAIIAPCIQPAKYLTDEIGWMLGKMAVDGLAILLKRVGIVHDLRDPFAPICSFLFDSKKQVSKYGLRLRSILAKNQEQVEAYRPKQQTRRVYARAEVSNDYQQRETQYLLEYRSTRIKKPKKQFIQPTAEDTAENNSTEIVDTREKIEIPGTSMILVPLVSEHINLWGIVSARESLDVYNAALQRPDLGVSGTGPLKFIRKTPTGQSYYELKPICNSDYRAVGMNHFDDEVEDVLYNAIKRYISYEDAMPIAASLFQQLNSNDKRIELINFDRIENHKEARKAFRSV